MGGARVSENFFTKNLNKTKEDEKKIFFSGRDRAGERTRASDFFYKESKSKKKKCFSSFFFFFFFFWWGVGGG